MIKKDKSDNIAYTEEYQKYFAKMTDVLFVQENKDEDVESYDLSYGYKQEYVRYAKVSSIDSPFHIFGANVTIKKSKKIIFNYKCINNGNILCDVIKHSNGNHYLVYCRDGYGYSVLELQTMREFHYYPAGTNPNTPLPEQEETFIISYIFYNKANNLLAANGNYFVYPYITMLADFSDPFSPIVKQLYLNPLLEPDANKRISMDIKGWAGRKLIINSYNRVKSDKPDKIVISEETYTGWLKDFEEGKIKEPELRAMGPFCTFGIIDDFDKEKDYGIYELDRNNCIRFSDNAIDDWWDKSVLMKTYFHKYSRPETAFARWGITLIPPESLEQFYDIVLNYTKSVFTNKQQLLDMILKAKSENKFMIHYGV